MPAVMMLQRLRFYRDNVLRYEDPVVCAKARAVLPLERFHAEARDAKAIAEEFGDGAQLKYEDYLMEELTHWFKRDFFKWVTTPRCWNCGRESTASMGMLQPTPLELQYGAERVEGYRCPQCGAEMRFPRYNDPIKLMKTRQGRCGEWANAFTCLCRCLDIEARFVVDFTDHVWTEFYSPGRSRWVHVDCCECQIDKPQLYEIGWGKKLSYVFAFDRYGVTDVTRRYVKDWNATLTRRREIGEVELEATVAALVAESRDQLPSETAQILTARDELERAALNGRMEKASEAVPGRTTGSVEWRQSRGETGSGGRVLRASATRFRRVVVPTRGASVAVRCSGEKIPDEMAVNLFDERDDTKWLDFGGGGVDGSAWIEYCIPNEAPPSVVTHYALVSANDCPQRDPTEWELRGLPAVQNSSWQILDRRGDIQFTRRHERRVFEVSKPVPCRRFRFCIWRTRGPNADAVQLAQLALKSALDDAPQLDGKMKELFNLFTAQKE